MRLANFSNGIAFKHDDICYFQSNHAHRISTGYFAHNAMSLKNIIYLLNGGNITIIDATRRHKRLTDALKFGVPTFCLVFNRAIYERKAQVCEWQTNEMLKISHSQIHKPLVQTIRKLMKIYDKSEPLIIGENVKLICHQGFIADDKPKRLKKMVANENN
jgi:hypothetical protein